MPLDLLCVDAKVDRVTQNKLEYNWIEHRLNVTKRKLFFINIAGVLNCNIYKVISNVNFVWHCQPSVPAKCPEWHSQCVNASLGKKIWPRSELHRYENYILYVLVAFWKSSAKKY